MKKATRTRKAAPKTRDLSVAGKLTIRGASDLRELLLNEISDGADLRLKMAKNDEMDVAGVQVLLAAAQSAKSSSARIRLPEHLPASIESWLTRAGIAMKGEE